MTPTIVTANPSAANNPSFFSRANRPIQRSRFIQVRILQWLKLRRLSPRDSGGSDQPCIALLHHDVGAQQIDLMFGRAGDYVGVGDGYVRIQKPDGLDGQGEGVTGNGYGEGFFDFGAAAAGWAGGSEVAVFGVAEGFGVGVAVIAGFGVGG